VIQARRKADFFLAQHDEVDIYQINVANYEWHLNA